MVTPRKKKEATKPPTQEVLVVPTVARQNKELVLEGDPEQQLEFAGKASRALMKRVESKTKKVIINGKQYLEYGDWQTLSRFFGATAGIDWTKRIERDGKYVGYEARAIVYQRGVIISSAEASCLTEEKNWKSRDEFAVKSMAQTRASAKALRNAFGWVAEMAGYASTPAEEMTYDTTPIKANAIPVVTYDDHEADEPPTPKELKMRIVAILKYHKVDITDKKAMEQFVADRTQLALVEVNFPEIIRVLESQDKQSNGQKN